MQFFSTNHCYDKINKHITVYFPMLAIQIAIPSVMIEAIKDVDA